MLETGKGLWFGQLFMRTEKRKKQRRLLIGTAAAVLAVLLLAGAAIVYLGTYYRADAEAAAAFETVREVPERELHGIGMLYGQGNEQTGLIFYPGAKVEESAYAPLMRELASRGVCCVLCRMPYRLAILKKNAADGVAELLPDVREWYIGGHSLGGVMAASYAADHPEAFSGVVLLASYTTDDLSDSGLKVLSVYGSEDGVLNAAAYEKNRENLPRDLTETVIAGGCHAGFGMYGPQKKDGVPSVPAAEQIRITADAILSLTGYGQNTEE